MCSELYAQEKLVPLKYNVNLQDVQHSHRVEKQTRLILPFVEDFSNEGPYPDPNKWLDSLVYINNTYSVDQVTKGVASFDGLNAKGRPHKPLISTASYSDSLTSRTIDLSSYTVASSIFISFFYQPQGLAFAPEPDDSLMLFFKTNTNQWEKVWQSIGSPYQEFKIDFVPIQASRFLHADFQFRFINIASMNINDDVWNIDYIKIDANRTNVDTNMNDLAFTSPPTPFLFPYTSMPYRHFISNQANEKTADFSSKVKNNYNNTITFSNNAVAIESISASPLNSAVLPSVTLGAKSNLIQSFLTFPISYVPPTPKSKVVLNQTYYYPPINAQDFRRNDTIVRETVFDNYFAYDDGSAEKSYFLYAAPNFPAKVALEFNLNEPDTLRGLMVHFGAQVPTAAGKYFSIVLYHTLGLPGLADSVILQQDLYQVNYDEAIQGFTTYAFSNPVLLNSGKYYIGITQPANFGSDSIYYGFDVNTNSSGQFLNFNVQGAWQQSSVNGSVMIRPIVGQAFTPSTIASIKQPSIELTIFPNPSSTNLYLKSEVKIVKYTIADLSGLLVANGNLRNQQVYIGNLPNGNYIITCFDEKGNKAIHKIQKQE